MKRFVGGKQCYVINIAKYGWDPPYAILDKRTVDYPHPKILTPNLGWAEVYAAGTFFERRSDAIAWLDSQLAALREELVLLDSEAS